MTESSGTLIHAFPDLGTDLLRQAPCEIQRALESAIQIFLLPGEWASSRRTNGSNTGALRRLTTYPADDAVPSRSRDGSWIYFASNRTGDPQVWKIPSQGGEAVQVTRNGGTVAFESPDGRQLYYAKERGATSLWRVPVNGGEEVQVLGPIRHNAFAISGRGAYFISMDHLSIQFFDFAGKKTRTIVSSEDPLGHFPSLCPDEKFILCTNVEQRGGDIMVVEDFQ